MIIYASIFALICPFIHSVIHLFIGLSIDSSIDSFLIHPFPDFHGSATITEVHQNGDVVPANKDNQNLYQVVFGYTVTLKCQPLTGYPQPTISWTRVEEPINDSRVSYHNMNTVLMISNIEESSGGFYRCIANNTIGNSESQLVTILVSNSGQCFQSNFV